jgi:hypothetical protein
MAVQTALSDTTPHNVQTDVKFGRIRKVYINAAIGATGAITVTAAGTSGQIAVTRTSTGLYAVTGLPTGGALRVLLSGGSIINDDGSPTAGDARVVTWNTISLSAGTANINTTAGDDGDVADPTSGTTLQAFLELQCGT